MKEIWSQYLVNPKESVNHATYVTKQAKQNLTS